MCTISLFLSSCLPVLCPSIISCVSSVSGAMMMPFLGGRYVVFCYSACPPCICVVLSCYYLRLPISSARAAACARYQHDVDSYVPQISSPDQPLPLLACDLDLLEPETIPWKVIVCCCPHINSSPRCSPWSQDRLDARYTAVLTRETATLGVNEVRRPG